MPLKALHQNLPKESSGASTKGMTRRCELFTTRFTRQIQGNNDVIGRACCCRGLSFILREVLGVFLEKIIKRDSHERSKSWPKRNVQIRTHAGRSARLAFPTKPARLMNTVGDFYHPFDADLAVVTVASHDLPRRHSSRVTGLFGYAHRMRGRRRVVFRFLPESVSSAA